MSDTLNIQWNGEEPTLIRQITNAPKVDISPGEFLPVERKLAEKYLKQSKKFKVFDEADEKLKKGAEGKIPTPPKPEQKKDHKKK